MKKQFKILKKAVELCKYNYEAHLALGNIGLFIHNYSMAEENFNISLTPSCIPESYQGVGFILYFVHNNGQAETFLKSAVQLLDTAYPTNVLMRAELYFNRAKIYYLHSKFKLSLQAIQEGLRITPDNYQLLELHNKVLLKLKPFSITQLFKDDILKLQTQELKYLSLEHIFFGTFSKYRM